MSKKLALTLLVTSVIGCVAEAGTEEETEVQSAPVIGGDLTYRRADVGIVQTDRGCTGTLITPTAVLTALHCSPYQNAQVVDVRGRGWTFEVQPPNNQPTRRYNVTRITVLGAYDGNDEPGWRHGDIAVLKLATAVPATVAKPARLGATWPAGMQRWSIFGYGCDGTPSGGDYKKKVTSFDGPSGTTQNINILCPGDSGGPMFSERTGELFGVNSGNGVGVNYFGDVPRWRTAILNAAR